MYETVFCHAMILQYDRCQFNIFLRYMNWNCCAPHVFLACEQPSTTFGVRPSGVLLMWKLCKPVNARTYAEYASRPVPEPVQCSYRCYLLSEPWILATANGSETRRRDPGPADEQVQKNMRGATCPRGCILVSSKIYIFKFCDFSKNIDSSARAPAAAPPVIDGGPMRAP